MSMYEDLEALAIEKSNVTWDFAGIFGKALCEKIGTNKVKIPIEKAYAENGVLRATIELVFEFSKKEDSVEIFRNFEIGISITATSKEVVVMKVGREKFEIEFSREGTSESLQRAVDRVAELFKNEINFTS